MGNDMATATPSSSAGAQATHALRQARDASSRVISAAADADEQGKTVEAVTMYREGLSLIRRALQGLKLGKDESWADARRIAAHMERTRDAVEDIVQKRSAASNSGPSPRGVAQPRRTTTSVPAPRSAKPGAPVPRSASATAAQSKEAPRQKDAKRFKNVDVKLAKTILDEVMETDSGVTLDDVVGLDDAKQVLTEVVLLSNQRPDIFKGLRAAPKGVLLYGPPGNGKTFLAKAIASQGGWTFFNISASSLMSKYVGEGEKMVRALFAMAREVQPSIIFIDEVDSLLTNRSANEHEAARRLKTEMLVQMEGVANDSDERVLVLAATNLPQEIDPAAMRRFPYRIHIRLPDDHTRFRVLCKLLEGVRHNLSSRDLADIAKKTNLYSASDLKALARDAVMYPLREVDPSLVATISEDEIRPVNKQDFMRARERIKASVTPEYLKGLEEFEKAHV